MHKVYYCVYMLMGIFTLFIFSCATTDHSKPDIVSTKKTDGAYSNAEVRQMVVDQPFLVSGDYFRERPTPKDTIDLKKIFQKNNVIEQRIAKLEKKVEQNQMPNHMDMAHKKKKSMKTMMHKSVKGPFTKIGLIMLDKNDYVKNELSYNLNLLSSSHDFLFFTHSYLAEILDPTDCLSNKKLKCILDNLSLYPGIRFLVVVENAKSSSKFPKQVALNIKVIDTGLNYVRTIVNTTKEFQNQDELKAYVKQISNDILTLAMKKRSVMPWFGKIFSIRNNKYYVNAGKFSQINKGDILKVVKYQDPITAPTGVPIAWSPGKTIGKLKVVRLIGEDISECIKIQGETDFHIGNIVIK